MRGWVGSWSPPNTIAGCRRLRVLGLSRPTTYAGLPGLLEPWQRNRQLALAPGNGPFQARYYAGFRGLLELTERNRTLKGPPCSGHFHAQNRGRLQAAVPATYACQVDVGLLRGPHPPRSLERGPGADGGIEAPIGFSIGPLSALLSSEA